jgi:hypothetical protein
MKTVIGVWSACLAAAVLTACATGPTASKPAAAATASAATGTAASPASAGNAAAGGITSGYTLVHKDGADFYCKKEKVTGSRTRTTDVCYTLAQLEAKQRGVDTLIQGMRDTSPQQSGADGMGGRPGASAVSQ